MVYRILDFGLDGVSRTSHTQHFASRCPLGVRIAALDHEILDDPMEKGAVLISLFHQLQEIVTVKRGLVIQANNDVAQHCLNSYFHFNSFLFICKIKQKKGIAEKIDTLM